MRRKTILVIIILGVLAGLGYYVYRSIRPSLGRSGHVWDWLRDPDSHPEWMVRAGSRCQPDAPFIFPTDGFVGFLYDDSFRPGNRHQGIDIFSGTDSGVTAVIAAYPGYLTRLPDWKSTVIVRIPSDPLQPGRQIWTYYTHLAEADGTSLIDPAFPPDTNEVFVPAGMLLGRQGNYSGTAGSPTGVHLHFSIVLDDGNGEFKNELEIENTLDPSPYLGLPLNGYENRDTVPVCVKE